MRVSFCIDLALGETLEVEVGQHCSMRKQIPMELKAAGQVMAQVSGRGRFHIVVEVVAVGRVRTVIDDATCPFHGSDPTQVGHSLLGDHHLGRMLTMVDVGAEWHDRRDLSPFGH
jgi:hypothetical protein